MTNQPLTYLLKVDGVTGDSTIEGYQGYFTVDEFTFNELTRLANGGGAGVGKAQFDPLMVDISGLSPGLVLLLKYAATGKHIPSVELVGLQSAGNGNLQKVYDLTLNNVTVAGYAADGGHDTAIAFDYTKMTETIKGQNADGSLNAGQTFTANVPGGNTPVDHNALAALAHSHQGPALTYLLKVDGVTGDSTIRGYEGYFTVDEFTFNELTRLANGSAGGSAGRAQFDPLLVDISGLSPGLVTLLKDAATGKHIPRVELVGLKSAGEGDLQKVYDLTLGNVTVAGFAADGGHDTAIAFDYTKMTETIRGQNPDGSLNAGQTFTANVAGGNTPVDHNALAALAHSHEGTALTYLLKVDGVTGDSTIHGYEGYFTVDEFTFNELTRLANGGTGGSAGRVQFDPLMVDISAMSPGLVTLLKDAATGKHIAGVELVGLKSAGEGGLQKVYDLTLNNVTVAGYAADGGHDTAIAFDYTKVSETIRGQNSDGSLNAGQTFTANVASGNTPVDANALAAFAHSHEGPVLTYLLKIDGVTGDSRVHGYEGYFTVDEFTFNELTRLANGGGGAGVGKAQFDPLMVDISALSPGLVTLLKDAATGKHIPGVELVGLKSAGEGDLQKVYDLTLNNVTVAGFAADGGHDTAIAFDYTRISETIKGQNPDGSLNAGQTFTADVTSGNTPVDHNALAGFAHSHDGPALTYLVKIEGVSGDSTIDGYQGYFGVDEFTFNELTRLANGAGAGGSAGKAQFDPLMVDISGLSPGLVTLLKDAATGKVIPSVELVGLQSTGEGQHQKIYDLTLNNVRVAGYAADGGHDTAIAFDYTGLTETIKGQNPDGSLNPGQTFAFNLATNGGSISPVNHDALAAFAHSHDGPELTYLLKVDGVAGDSAIHGYQGYFGVDEFTFSELTLLANGGGGGAGAGKAQFDPLTVDLSGLSPGLVTLLKDAATGKHIASVELVGLKSAGEGDPQKVYDLTLNNVTVAGFAADGGHDTAIAFDYTRLTETIRGQNPDGSLNAGQTFATDVTNGNTPVDHNALAAFAHAHDGFFLA